MAVTVLPMSSLTETVKQAVRSTTTCSDSTVLSLQTLLRGSSMGPEKPARKNTKSTKDPAAPVSRARTSRTTKTKTSADTTTTLQSIVDQDAAGLTLQEKLVLATEVFNVTLKTLTDASKVTTTKRQPISDPASTKSGRSSVASLDSGIYSAAECARLALSTLRTLKNDQASQELPNMQLEQGVCVLAGKLISLGLNDMACKELRSLKRRIQQHLNAKRAGKKIADCKDTISDEETGKERMSDLISFSNLAHAQPVYGLLVSYHSNVMRLLASDKRAPTIQKVCPLLQLSDPSSPAQIITAAMKTGALASDKAALQLQLLSNTVLSLSSAKPSTSNEDSTTSKDSTKPLTALTLQLLSLEIRCLGWKISGHLCDEGREMFDPLIRYLGNFSQRSKGVEKTEFSTIYKAISRIQLTMADVKKKPQDAKDLNLGAKIMTILGQLALDAGCFDESLKLLSQAITPFTTSQSLSLATVRCKIASVYFQALKGSTTYLDGALKSTSEATDALGLQLRGSAGDLDELLVEAARLKKLALAWFGDAMTKKVRSDTEKSEIACQIREYLQAFLRFLRRYVGRPLAEDADDKEIEMFKNRISMSKSIILAAVDSAIAVGKLSVMSQRPPWEDMLPILTDSHRLLTSVESTTDSESDETLTESISLGLVKLSNLFWSRYIKEKEAGQGYRELIPLLRHSTQFLSGCSSSHRTTAFAALKFERTAHLYVDGNMYGDAEKAFRQSIAEYIDTGALEQMGADHPASLSSSAKLDPQSPSFMLNRVLTGLLKVKLRGKGSKSSSFYDDGNLDVEGRGILLEWQMGILFDLHNYSSSEDDFRSIFTSVVSNLLDIYSPDSNPIRHGRVILSVLRFLLEHPSALDSDMAEKVMEEGAQDLDRVNLIGQDTDLTPFATHITNSLRVIIGFHDGKMDAGELDDTLASWASMARQCSDWETLLGCVHDTEYWVLQLKALVDYTEIHGLWKAQLNALELILRAAELQKFGDLSDAIIILSRLVLQHCQLGHCQKAGKLLSRGEQYLTQHDVSSLASISFKLAKVEHLLETGEVDKASTTLSMARKMYEKTQKSDELSGLTVLAKISWERLVADAAFVQSRLSTAQGSMTHALYFAKLSVRLNCRIWAKVERLAQKKQDKSLSAAGSSDMDAVAEGVAKLDLSQNGSSPDVSPSYIQGAPFWPHLGSHHTCLLNLATLSAHHGLFQDAIYYGEQALKIDKTLDANIRLVAAQTQLGCYRTIGGDVVEGQELLLAASESSKQLPASVETVSLQMALASLYKAQGHHDKALRLLQEADKVITAVISSDTISISDGPNVAALEEKMERLQVRTTRRAQGAATTTTTATTGRRTRSTSSAASNTTITNAKRTSAPKTPRPEAQAQSQSLLRLKGDVLRQQADCLRALRDFDRSARTLAEARQFATARESKVSLEIGESEHLLAEAIRKFASHAVYCVLPESTISLPSLKTPTKIVEEITPPAATKSTTARKTRAPARGVRGKVQKAGEDFSMMLSKASDCLTSVFADATVLGSTLESHAASRLMSRISMLSHATNPGGPATLAQSPANMNEIGRVGAFARERMAIDFDRKLVDYADPLLWPTSITSTNEMDETICSNFAEQYIDILPENWNVLSLSLSADQTEFVVSRLQKNRSPFLLRLPLRRGSEDDEEEQFTFEDGKEEMAELIRLANESAHAAKLQTDKSMKKEWWKNRETLDRRMESLLQNVENIWFGGFRGIFSPLPRDSTALSRFAGAFQALLDKHLPSRQKGGKAASASGSASPRLTLHQNVLELFIGLRDLEEQEEPEDTLMDLLYFVVDILQFQGERNAYDEIDFDMMVLDTLDALRGYHKAAKEELSSQQPSHTILVLDKALHLFPWESIPCLQGYPVTRVPSLECLRERVLQFRPSASGTILDRSSGAYILNPTGDLRTTQETFEKDLSGQKSWVGITKREPSEEEFRTSLENKDLFLYFGHGSGAQYIRGRTVKRLTKCAVAFLMGCSSGSLTEAGEYEPYGTPMNYLQAGSPALVATLWDVTDKDIDRFSTSAFETWGLLGKGKQGSLSGAGAGADDGEVGLDTAIAGARRSCVLKYLNGAAPVVYGVPVFLE
ncbi:Peptidase C50 separase [Penicillium waksmanii]|uniref:Peptidase C50 separase n=1 Tax=Penicillium waksmanii TaxID=69791 RepID=UPI0025487DF7|nr:Peptidase C50 separase [Penicillium waksmanii]KAJ6000051.1 Peptidase C50 separase [Penicillium waksmanii]